MDIRGSMDYSHFPNYILEMGNCLILFSDQGSYFSIDGGDTWTWKEDVDRERLFDKDCSPKLIKLEKYS